MVRMRYIGLEALLALAAVAVLTAALAPGCFAAAKGSDAARGAAAQRTIASLRKLSRSLSQQIDALEARTSALEAFQPPRFAPISMLAGGDLTGTFPAPALAQATVGSAEIIDGSIQSVDLADGAVTAADLRQGSIPPPAVGRLASLELGSSAIDSFTLGHIDTRVGTAGTAPANGFALTKANCQETPFAVAGRVLSGGWRTGREDMRIMAFSPAFPENGQDANKEWLVAAHVDNGGSGQLTPEATCLK
jgi:hypothetical protein